MGMSEEEGMNVEEARGGREARAKYTRESDAKERPRVMKDLKLDSYTQSGQCVTKAEDKGRTTMMFFSA